jgi:hypothetical protein
MKNGNAEIIDAGLAETERDECGLPVMPQRVPPLEVPPAPKVLGLDLSLAATGIACIWGERAWTELVRAKALPDRSALSSWARFERIDLIGNAVLDYARGATLVVVEGPSLHSPAGGERGHFERAGLWWDVLRKLRRARVAFAVASPASIKTYATGKGSAKKDLVLAETVRRFGMVRGLSDNNEADALVAAAMGSDWLGWPIVPMPELHRRALPGVDWRIEGNPGPVVEALETARDGWAG